MNDLISTFIATKKLSTNTQKSYAYDLAQFLTVIDGKITTDKLTVYESFLSHLTVSAKKRKLSAVNQFLYYLYKTGTLSDFFRLENKEKLTIKKSQYVYRDLTTYYDVETEYVQGKAIFILISELGLLPNEIQLLKWENIDLTFAILKVIKSDMVRIIELSPLLQIIFEQQKKDGAIYLFEHGEHKPFSRQWYFNQLNIFLQSIGLEEFTAQKLREQYILKEKQRGRSLLEVSYSLGLKSPVTLEKYYKE